MPGLLAIPWRASRHAGRWSTWSWPVIGPAGFQPPSRARSWPGVRRRRHWARLRSGLPSPMRDGKPSHDQAQDRDRGGAYPRVLCRRPACDRRRGTFPGAVARTAGGCSSAMRSCTTSGWSIGWLPAVPASSRNCATCPRAASSCSAPTAFPGGWSVKPGTAAFTWSTRPVPLSGACTTKPHARAHWATR